MSRLAWAVALFSLIALPASAQEQPAVTVDQVIDALLAQAVGAAEKKLNPVPFSRAVESSAGGPILQLAAARLVDREAYKTLADLMAVSTATQVGSTSDSGGTTSLALKGLVPAILGFAVEQGAIGQDVNETVATFRVSPAGFVKALQGKGLLDIYHDYSRSQAYRVASMFSGSISFDTSRGAGAGSLTADRQQLAAWSISVTLLNERDPRAKGYGREWREVARQQGGPLIAARSNLDQALQKWPAFTSWQERLATRVSREVDEPWARDGDTRSASARFRAILESELPAIAEFEEPDAAVVAAMSAYITQLTTVVEARNDVYAYANEGAIATFDWTTTRDETLPDLYTLTAVYEDSFSGSRKDDFTANVALRVYREAPAGASRRLRDVSVTAQWDRPLGSVFEIPFIFSAAARYQFMPDDTPVPTSAIEVIEGSAVAPKGHLALGQAKLTIPLKSGVRIPLSITLANRTPLIQEKDVRANFGITFNLDAFVAAFKASRQ